MKKKDRKDPDFHFSYWKDDYTSIKYAYAEMYQQAEILLKNLEDFEKKITRYEAVRREHAVNFGVQIIESDKVFDIEKIRSSIPALVKNIRENFLKIGLGKNDAE